MLSSLQEGPSTVTDLSDLVDISSPEVSRHLSRLAEHDFIKRDPNTRKYMITPFGRTTLKLFRPLQSIFNGASYFSSHKIDILPNYLLFEINILDNMQFIEGTGKVMLAMKELIDGVEQEVRLIVDQPFPFGKEHIAASYLVPADFPMVDPKELQNNKITIKGIKVIDTIPLALALQDDQKGLLFFANLSGKIDYSYGFKADKDSINYLIRIWKYYWDQAALVDFD